MQYLTRQQVFNKVTKHLLKQKVRALAHGGCRYRTESGLKCAIGCLLKDYDPLIEGLTPEALVDNYPRVDNLEPGLLTTLLFEARIDASDIEFLAALQHLHDRRIDYAFPPLLREFAEAWQLKLPKELKDATK